MTQTLQRVCLVGCLGRLGLTGPRVAAAAATPSRSPSELREPHEPAGLLVPQAEAQAGEAASEGQGIRRTQLGCGVDAALKLVVGDARPKVAHNRRAAWQLINTGVPYLVLFASLMEAIRRGASVWLCLALAVPASAFMVRLFVLFHDCVHGSFVGSARHCRIIGRALGVLVLTPYGNWRYHHLTHHATAGDLDRRNTGDIWTLTVEEYRRATLWQRLSYRIFRLPPVMFGLGPLVLFLFLHRLPGANPTRARTWSVLGTNAVVVAVGAAWCLAFGVKAYLAAQLAVLLLGGAGGVWLFYVQHQFSPSYWSRHERWDVVRAALEGSSYYKLPKLLQWFSASIGLHHVHFSNLRKPWTQAGRRTCPSLAAAARAPPALVSTLSTT